MGLFSMFGKKKREYIVLSELNDECNAMFGKIFEDCRLQFGRELVELMNIKASMFQCLEEACKNRNRNVADNETRQKILLNVLSLFSFYLKVTEEYCTILKVTGPGINSSGMLGTATDVDAEMILKGKLDKAHELILSLNRHFYVTSADSIAMAEFDEVLIQAEALCNAISVNYAREME